MKENNKTQTIHFRIDSQYKRWLDLLIKESCPTSVTGYFYSLIYDQINKHLTEKAYEAGRDYTSKEFGITDSIREAIKKPKDIKGLFGSAKNETKFLDCWANESINRILDLSLEFEIRASDLLKTLRDKFTDLFNENRYNLIEQIIGAHDLIMLDKKAHEAFENWQKTDEYKKMTTDWHNVFEKYVKSMIDKTNLLRKREEKNATE